MILREILLIFAPIKMGNMKKRDNITQPSAVCNVVAQQGYCFSISFQDVNTVFYS